MASTATWDGGARAPSMTAAMNCLSLCNEIKSASLCMSVAKTMDQAPSPDQGRSRLSPIGSRYSCKTTLQSIATC